MEISRVDLLQMLGRTYETTSNSSLLSLPEDDSRSMSTRFPETLDISALGKSRNAISQMSDEEKAEMRVFHEEMMEAVKNGTFDASTMAANAPDALKSFAEENGVDLETMMEDQAFMMQNMANTQGPPPPPPPQMYGSDGQGTAYSSQDVSMDFLKRLLQGEDVEGTLLSGVNEA